MEGLDGPLVRYLTQVDSVQLEMKANTINVRLISSHTLLRMKLAS